MKKLGQLLPLVVVMRRGIYGEEMGKMKKFYQRFGMRHLNQEFMDYSLARIEKYIQLTHLTSKRIDQD